MNLHKKLGIMIREARQAKDMTQLDLAYELGYESMQFVSLMERNLSKIPRPILKKLIKILDLNRAEIFQLILEDFTKKLQADI